MKLLQKIHNNHYNINVPETYKTNNEHIIDLRNTSCYKIHNARYDGYKHSFFNRSIFIWNQYNEDITMTTDTETFINMIKDGTEISNKYFHQYIKRLGINSLNNDLNILDTTYTYH